DIRWPHRIDAADHCPAAAAQRVLDVRRDDVQLAGHHDRAVVSLGLRAGAQRAGDGGYLGEELVVDPGDRVYTLDADATLAGIDHAAPYRRLGGRPQVGVGGHDERVL